MDENRDERLDRFAQKVRSALRRLSGRVSALEEDGTLLDLREKTGALETSLTAALGRVESQVRDAAAGYSQVTQTAEELRSEVGDLRGNVSTLSQTAEGLETKVTSLDGSLSSISQRVSSITLRVANVDGTVSEFRIGSGSIDLTSAMVRLLGDMAVFAKAGDETAAGFLGYGSGRTDGDATKGIHMYCNDSGGSTVSEVICTDSGARMTYGGSSIYAAGDGVSVTGSGLRVGGVRVPTVICGRGTIPYYAASSGTVTVSYGHTFSQAPVVLTTQPFNTCNIEAHPGTTQFQAVVPETGSTGTKAFQWVAIGF